MYLLASRQRPHKLALFAEAYRETLATEPVTILVDEDDPTLHSYHSINLPAPLMYEVSAPGLPGQKVNNWISNNLQSVDYVGVLGDDVLPRTVGWDRCLAAESQRDGGIIAYARDGIQDDRLATHPVIGKQLLQVLGWFTPPQLAHYYADNFWTISGRKLNRLRYAADIYLEHMHPAGGKARADAISNRLQQMYTRDTTAWEDMQIFGDVEIYINRLLRIVGRHG